MIEIHQVPVNERLTPEVLLPVREIFFASTNRKFTSSHVRSKFFNNWTDFYLMTPQCDVIVAKENGKILGYLMGCRDSKNGLEPLANKINSYGVFADLFEFFPGHLHVNLFPEARGKGIGSLLIDHFSSVLLATGFRGVHIVTSPNERNVEFYKKNGFHHREVRLWKGNKLLFMGKSLGH